jgi:hypothetical protein
MMSEHEHDWTYYQHRDVGGWPILRQQIDAVRVCQGCSLLQFKAPGELLYGHDSGLDGLASSVLVQWFEKRRDD